MTVGDLVKFVGMPEYGVGVITRHVDMYADTVEVFWSQTPYKGLYERLTFCPTKMLEVVSA